MSPNTPEMPRTVFSMLFEACLVNLELKALNRLPVGCLRGTLFVTKVLAGFFVSSESVSYTLMDPVESSRT